MIKVLKPGLYTTVQDLGRLGVQEYGVPVSGAMDAGSAAMANAILNNQQSAALLEMTLTGPTLLFTTDTNICLTGADMSPGLCGKLLKMNKAIPVTAGDVLSFGRLRFGCRGYLAVSGGILTPKILGSRSMYPGITDAAKLSLHDTLAIKQGVAPIRLNASIAKDAERRWSTTLHAFPGPEYDLLSEQQKKKLFAMSFSISTSGNRMAYPLTTHFDSVLYSMISSLVLPGTVQLTPSGRLIILMRDCQTTGGYPRILQLRQDAIDNLAQKFANDTIDFSLNRA